MHARWKSSITHGCLLDVGARPLRRMQKSLGLNRLRGVVGYVTTRHAKKSPNCTPGSRHSQIQFLRRTSPLSFLPLTLSSPVMPLFPFATAVLMVHSDPFVACRHLRYWIVDDKLAGFQVVFQHSISGELLPGRRFLVYGLPCDLPHTQETTLDDGECVVQLTQYFGRDKKLCAIAVTMNTHCRFVVDQPTDLACTTDVPADSLASCLVVKSRRGAVKSLKLLLAVKPTISELVMCLQFFERACDGLEAKDAARVKPFREDFVLVSHKIRDLNELDCISADSFIPLLVQYGDEAAAQLNSVFWWLVSRNDYRFAKIDLLHHKLRDVLRVLARYSAMEASWLLKDDASVQPGVVKLKCFARREITTDNVQLMVKLQAKHTQLMFHWKTTERLIIFLVMSGDDEQLHLICTTHARAFSQTLGEAMEVFASEIPLVKLAIVNEQSRVLRWFAVTAQLNVLEPPLAPLADSFPISKLNDSAVFTSSPWQLANNVQDPENQRAIVSILQYFKSRRDFTARVESWTTDHTLVDCEALHALVPDITSVSDLHVFFNMGQLSPPARQKIVQAALGYVLVEKVELLADVTAAVDFADYAVEAHRLSYISDHDWRLMYLLIVRANMASAAWVLDIQNRANQLGAAVRQIHAQVTSLEDGLATVVLRDLSRSLRERRDHLVTTASAVLFVVGGPVIRLFLSSLVKFKPVMLLLDMLHVDEDDVTCFLTDEAAEVVNNAAEFVMQPCPSTRRNPWEWKGRRGLARSIHGESQPITA